MILAISLVYSNTKSIIAINEASREYIKKKDAADSTMTSLLKEEQKNLKQLSDAMAGKSTSNYLQDKVKKSEYRQGFYRCSFQSPTNPRGKENYGGSNEDPPRILPPTS